MQVFTWNRAYDAGKNLKIITAAYEPFFFFFHLFLLVGG